MYSANLQSQEIKDAFEKIMADKMDREAIDVLCRVINDSVSQSINEAYLDRTYQGLIKQNLGNGSYRISMKNQEYTVKSETNRVNIPTGSTVRVVVPQNNFSEIFIF